MDGGGEAAGDALAQPVCGHDKPVTKRMLGSPCCAQNMNFGEGNVNTRAGTALRTLAAGAAVAVVAVGFASPARASSSASTVRPVQYLDATGSVSPPPFQTFSAASTGSGPAHVAVTVTQTGAVKFSIKSVFSDDTAGASLSSNDAATTDIESYDGSIIWGETDGDVDSGTYQYESPGTYQVTDTVTDSNGATATATVEVSTQGSAYTPVNPTRILDTRKGLGAPEGEVGSGSIVKLRVEGAGPVPASGISAVVLNLTAVATTGSGYVTAYPSDDGASVPHVSSLDYRAGETVANFVTVPVGKDGYVYLANEGAPISLIADDSGYYSLTGTQGYEPAEGETRLLDTRVGTGAPKAAVPNGGTVKLLTALGDTYLAGPGDMTAVDVNITVVDPTATGYITAYADGTSRPGTSTVNYVKGQTVANNAIVPVAADGSIDLTNVMTAAGSVELVVDVAGYFEAGGLYDYVPMNPTRVFDSRLDGQGQIENGIEYELDLGDWAQNLGDPDLQFNVTVTDAKSSGYLTLYSVGASLPDTSNVNWDGPGQLAANAAFVNPVGSGWISMYNGGGAGADVILDLFGYYQSSWP